MLARGVRATTIKPAGRRKRSKEKEAAPKEGSDDEEEEGEDPDSEHDGGGQDAQRDGGQDGGGQPGPSEDRTNKEMEVQGCDPEECDYMCGECEWEPCVVLADHGRTCDVRICSHGDDDSECFGVANRFLRFPAATTHRAKRVKQ